MVSLPENDFISNKYSSYIDLTEPDDLYKLNT
jgi:hypothetical protein